MDDSTSPLPALNRQAIDAALNCNWEVALTINQQILDLEPENVAGLNRMATALFKLGKYKEARKNYQEVLRLDPYNPIAAKNIKRLQSFKKDEEPKNGQANGAPRQKLSAAFFLQEPGTTKVVNLLKVAEPQKLSTLTSGMEVKLAPKNRGISVVDMDETYLGVLPDDLSHQLGRYLKGGNKYQALIRSVKSNGLTIIIREIHRAARYNNQPSFLDEAYVVSLPSDHISLYENTESREEPEVEEVVV